MSEENAEGYMAKLVAKRFETSGNEEERPILGFTKDEKVVEASGEHLPLVLSTSIFGQNITRCLIDEGSSVDILYQDAFERLNLKEEDLKIYSGMRLHGFNAKYILPRGYVNLDVIFGEE